MNYLIIIMLFICFKSVGQSRYVSAIFPGQAACGDDSQWVLFFEDIFSGNTVDLNKWSPEQTWSDFGGTYIDASNIRVNGGKLFIDSYKFPSVINQIVWSDTDGLIPKEYKYSSGSVNTYQKSTWRYGKFEGRIKIAGGYGLWPAFWLYTDTPEWNEIDIFEFWTKNYGNGSTGNKKNKNKKNQPKIHHMTVHKKIDESDKDMDIESYKGVDYSLGFHNFSIEWSPYKIVWKVDGDVKRTHYRYYDATGMIELECTDLYAGRLVVEDRLFTTENMLLYMNTGIEHEVDPQDRSNFYEPDLSPGGSPLPTSMAIEWVRIYKMDYCLENVIVANRDVDNYEKDLITGQYLTIGGGTPIGFIMRPNTNVYTKATQKITFTANTHILTGSKLTAKIKPCGLKSGNAETNFSYSPISKERDVIQNNNITHVQKQIDFIYPNPSSSGIYYLPTTTSDISALELYDLSNNLIKIINNPKGKLDLSHYTKGVYIIKIITKDANIQYEKIIYN